MRMFQKNTIMPPSELFLVQSSGAKVQDMQHNGNLISNLIFHRLWLRVVDICSYYSAHFFFLLFSGLVSTQQSLKFQKMCFLTFFTKLTIRGNVLNLYLKK